MLYVCLGDVTDQFLSKKYPMWMLSKTKRINAQEWDRGIGNTSLFVLSDFWDPQGWVEVSGLWNIWKHNSLPSTRVSKRCPPSSVVRHGHPLLPLPLHLPQDLQLPWQTLCEEQPGVVLFPGPWLLEGGQQPTGLQGLPWLKPPGDLYRSLHCQEWV